MGKIVILGEFKDKKQKQNIEKAILERVDQIEKDLGLEEPLTVLSDDTVLSIANSLIDARDEINDALSTLGVEESEELPWDEE